MKNLSGLLIAGCLVLGSCKNDSGSGSVSMETGKDYPVYGGNKAGNRYSPLTGINSNNVKDLKVAWTYFANDTSNHMPAGNGEIQCQPIVVNGILYGTSAELDLFALKAGTGELVWKFKPVKENQTFNTNRGVIYWEDGDDKRVLYWAGSSLYAINALTGMPVSGFGKEGKVDLHEGLSDNIGHDISKLTVTATTPGVIYKNTLVIGSSVSESGDAAPGHIRAFDVVTGKLKWVFHTIPQPGEFGYDTWPKDAYKKIGGANNWSGMVADTKRGIVYLGTGSPSSDFYGGDREGTNLFANCILALDAETGKLKWYFQTIHHDLWDRDIPCPPNLITINHDGKKRDVVVQATKDGMVYVLDRDDGTSLFPIEERPVPTTGLPGEHPYPTQKYPLKPAPFTRQLFTDKDISDISPESNAFVSKLYPELKTANKFQPPSTAGTLLFGYSGGAEWGGNAIDPDGILYVNANEHPWVLKMIDRETRDKEIASLSQGHALYIKNCAACHGEDRKGNANVFPTLINIEKKHSRDEMSSLIKTGKGRMPSFQTLSEQERSAIIGYLLNRQYRLPKIENEHSNTEVASAGKADFPYQPEYINRVWQRLSDQDGYNAIKPPWGTLNALDLNTGEYLWHVPLGEYPELSGKGIPITGTDTYGGPVVTAGGLVFIASTRDERIRAFDKKTGKVVWEYQLPAGGFATPITYEADGKQYIVIAAGGARGARPGGWYVAFALK